MFLRIARPVYYLKSLKRVSWITTSVVTVIILVFVSEWLQKIGIGLPMGFRHIMILSVFFINWIFFGRPIKLNQYYLFGIILIFLFLVIAYFFSGVSLMKYLLGTVFTFLFLLIFILGANTNTKITTVTKIFKYVLVFIIVMSAGPIIKGVLTGNTLRNVPPGLFRELGAFGSSMNIGVIISLVLYIITGNKKYIVAAIILSFGVFFTILKKSILSNLIVWASFALLNASSRTKVKIFIYGISFFAMSMIFAGDALIKDINKNITYFRRVGIERHVRTGMYVASFRIANDYFPFGSGMGTFGSLASIVNGYSNIYHKYGVSKIASNSPRHVAIHHHTLLDTYWPHIIAELGFLGGFIFLFLWTFPISLAYRVFNKTEEKTLKGLSFYIFLIIIVMTNEGFTLYTPEIPSFVILHSGLTGLCYYHLKSRLQG